jgi:hypothetical protein
MNWQISIRVFGNDRRLLNVEAGANRHETVFQFEQNVSFHLIDGTYELFRQGCKSIGEDTLQFAASK